MILFLLITGLTLISARISFTPISLNYHEEFGIPEATRIQKAEAALDFDGSRIVGGSVAGLGAHPYIGGLVVNLTDGRTSMCSSSLLSNTRLVTAAHCWRVGDLQGSQLTVVLGSTRLFYGGTRITTNNVQPHENYNESNLNNDIALITIAHVEYNNIIGKIELPSGILLSLTFSEEQVVAAGYGRTSDFGGANNNPELRHTILTVIQNWQCVNVYGPQRVTASTLCTSGVGGVGPCTGDSGGPLVFTCIGVRYLIGVNTFVAGGGCELNLPAGYARITLFARWINARL